MQFKTTEQEDAATIYHLFCEFLTLIQAWRYDKNRLIELLTSIETSNETEVNMIGLALTLVQNNDKV